MEKKSMYVRFKESEMNPQTWDDIDTLHVENIMMPSTTEKAEF